MEHAWQIRVTKVLDPNNFYAQFSQVSGSKFEEFEQLEAELQSYCAESRKQNCILETDMLVLAYSTVLEKWARAEVVRVDSEVEEVDVWYIDYGMSEMCDCGDILGECDPRFLQLDRMAYLCSLADVKPLANKWISRAVSFFSDLVLDETAHCDVILLDSQSLLYTRIYVTLEEGGEASVADLMIAEDFALPAELPVTGQTSVSESLEKSPRLKTDFENLFKEPPKVEQKVKKPKIAHKEIDAQDKEQMMGDLTFMFGEEIVKEILVKGASSKADEVEIEENELTVEEQIRKMRHRRNVDTDSPSRSRSPRYRDVTSASPKHRVKTDDVSTAQHHNNRHPNHRYGLNNTRKPNRSQENRSQQKVPPHKPRQDEKERKERVKKGRMKKLELTGQKKDDKITSVICDLSEIVGGTHVKEIRNSLDHILYCFDTYVLDVNEFLNPEELCNDLQSFLDKCLQFPQLSNKIMRLISNVQDHDIFSAAVSFALPRFVDDGLKTHAPNRRSSDVLCNVLVDLYNTSSKWRDECRLTVHELITKTLQTWLNTIVRPDSSPSRVSLYASCLDAVLPPIGQHLQKHYEKQCDALVDSMREAVLATHIDRSDREIVLDLMLLDSRRWSDQPPKPETGSSDIPDVKRSKNHEQDDVTASTARSDDVTKRRRGDVTARIADVMTSDDDREEDEYVNVRLMLLELNLSQYLDDMKQCGINDEIMTSLDIDLASLMRDFDIPTPVSKRILLHLDREVPQWVHDSDKCRIITEEKAPPPPKKPSYPDWSKYRDPDKVQPCGPPPYVSDFIPDSIIQQKKSLFPSEPIVTTVTSVEGQQTITPHNDGADIPMDDVEFPPLKSAESDDVTPQLTAPPAVTRVTNDWADDNCRPHGSSVSASLRISDLAKEIINSSYSEALKSKPEQNETKDLAEIIKAKTIKMESNWRVRESEPENDANWRVKASPVTPVEDSQVDETEKEDKKEVEDEKTEERVNLVALCHDTGALDFKFQDEEEEEEKKVSGLNAVVDLFSEPAVKNSPVTRNTRPSSRPNSAASRSSHADSISSPSKFTPDDWFDMEITTNRSRGDDMTSSLLSPLATKTLVQKSGLITRSDVINKEESRGSTPTYWADLDSSGKTSPSTPAIPGSTNFDAIQASGDAPPNVTQNSPSKTFSPKISPGVKSDFSPIKATDRQIEDLERSLDEDEFDEFDNESEDESDSDDDGVNIILTTREAQQALLEEKRRKMEKYITKPKVNEESTFKGFNSYFCTRCGAKDHDFNRCQSKSRKPLIY